MNSNRKKKSVFICLAVAFFLTAGMLISYFSVKAAFPRPYRETVSKSDVPESLIYAIAKAESGFRENAVSKAGAIGVMQLMPSTAEFICRVDGIAFDIERLYEGEYNVRLGSAYLKYLLKRFSEEETAIAAYNAGEGIVREWLKRGELSPDGKKLIAIPFGETETYVKKVKKFRKFYEFFYDKT